MRDEMSPTEANDAGCFIVSPKQRHVELSASFAFNGLKSDGGLMDTSSSGEGFVFLYPPDQNREGEARESKSPGRTVDFGAHSQYPTNWFELAVDLCAAGEIPHERFVAAVEAVRQGVERE